MAEEENDLSVEAAPKSAPAQNPLLIIFLFLNFVALAVVAYLQYRSHQEEASRMSVREIVSAQIREELGKEEFSEDATKEKESIKELLLPLEGFTANLAQGDGPRRYVRLNIVLKFSKESRPDEFRAAKPQIRDAIIGILNAKRAEDLLQKEGKKYLKEEIKSAINFFLIDGQVMDVYYVGFQIN